MKFLSKKEEKKFLKKHGIELAGGLSLAIEGDNVFAFRKNALQLPLEKLNVKRVGILLGKIDKEKLEILDSASHLLL